VREFIRSVTWPQLTTALAAITVALLGIDYFVRDIARGAWFSAFLDLFSGMFMAAGCFVLVLRDRRRERAAALVREGTS
jgi:preprotein translocase subunit SecF